MKKVIIYILTLSILVPVYGEGLQMFSGKKKSAKAENQAQEEESIMDFSSSTVTQRKNIESVIPVKRIPDGWVFRDELLAPWESNLPAVLSIIPDTTVEVVYHDDNRTTKEGFVLPIKRASVEFQYTHA